MIREIWSRSRAGPKGDFNVAIPNIAKCAAAAAPNNAHAGL